MKKRITFIILVCVNALFIMGLGKKNVELLDKDALIDLTKAIELVTPGTDSNSTQNSSDDSGTAVVDPDASTVNPEPDPDVPVKPDYVEKKYEIEIRKKEIKYNQIIISLDSLEKQIEDESDDKKINVVLIDNYAERGCYKSVKEVLERIKDKGKITYDEKPR